MIQALPVVGVYPSGWLGLPLRLKLVWQHNGPLLSCFCACLQAKPFPCHQTRLPNCNSCCLPKGLINPTLTFPSCLGKLQRLMAGADSADAQPPVPGIVFIYYSNTGKHDPGIHGRSQIQRKEFEKATSFINSHLCGHFQLRPETVQGLKAESTLPQEGQKDVSGHSAVRAEVSVFQVPCPGSSGHFHSARRAK